MEESFLPAELLRHLHVLLLVGHLVVLLLPLAYRPADKKNGAALPLQYPFPAVIPRVPLQPRFPKDDSHFFPIFGHGDILARSYFYFALVILRRV